MDTETTEMNEVDELREEDLESGSPEIDDDEGPSGSKPVVGLDPDAILDTIVPENIDWRSTVRRFPALTVAGVTLVGYFVGRTKGRVIISGLTAGLSAAMMNQLSDVFEGDFFDY